MISYSYMKIHNVWIVYTLFVSLPLAHYFHALMPKHAYFTKCVGLWNFIQVVIKITLNKVSGAWQSCGSSSLFALVGPYSKSSWDDHLRSKQCLRTFLGSLQKIFNFWGSKMCQFNWKRRKEAEKDNLEPHSQRCKFSHLRFQYRRWNLSMLGWSLQVGKCCCLWTLLLSLFPLSIPSIWEKKQGSQEKRAYWLTLQTQQRFVRTL